MPGASGLPGASGIGAIGVRTLLTLFFYPKAEPLSSLQDHPEYLVVSYALR